MLQSIINFLNLKLDLLNYFDLTRCLCELKEDSEGKVSPEEYISNGNWDNVDFDAHNGISYWRLRDEITVTPLDNSYKAGKRVETIVPLKLVFSVPRTKLTADDAYSYDRIRQTIVKQFNIDDGTLKTTLGAEKILITSPTANGDAKEVWDGETADTGTHEPKYEVVFGSVDIDISIISKGECLPTECDDVDSDILHTFDFCSPVVIGRLTPTQVTCLESEFGGAVVTEQINGVTIGTVAPGNTNNQVIQSALGTPVGTAANPSVIANGVIQVNGVNVGSSVAEGTYDQAIHDSAGSDVGTAANPSVVSDNTINFNGSDVDTVKAQETYTFTVELNSVQAGSYDAGTNKVSITSTNPSLAASVDDSTPDFGDTITITATPTDITPTSYTYVLPDGTTVTQAGSTYDWDVNVSGSQIIIVTATDGVSDVCGSVDVTIATIYVKHGITAAWEGKDAVIESDGQVDSNTDSTGNGNTATAPAAANRMIKYSDPRNTNNGMVGALGNSSTMRLGTSLSQLQSTITYFAVFDNIETGNTGVFNQHSLIGGDATPASNAGGRFDFRINTSTEAMFISVRQSSGATGAVINTATIAHGKNVVVMTYDGSNLRVNLNGTVQTAAWAGSLWTPASCNVVLMNSNISSYTAGCTSPYSVLGVKTSSLSDADADQLYDDLLIKYAG
jgi:hypothetical protein